MNGIFDTGDGRKLVMYEHGNAVFMSVISREFSGRPILLSGDYEKDLTSCILDNRLYYAYIAANHHIKIKSIDEAQTKWEFDEPAKNLFLTVYENALVLFYTKEEMPEKETVEKNDAEGQDTDKKEGSRSADSISENPEAKTAECASDASETNDDGCPSGVLETNDDRCSSDASETENTGAHGNSADSGSNINSVRVCCHALTGEPNISEASLLMRLYETSEIPKPFIDFCVKTDVDRQVNETVLQAKKDYLFSITAELEEKYAKKETKLKAYYAEQLAQSEESIRTQSEKAAAEKAAAAQALYSERLAEQEAELTKRCDERVAEKEKKIKELNSTISKIKLQYEQLMKTALSYKEDAAKWHSLYHSRGR